MAHPLVVVLLLNRSEAESLPSRFAFVAGRRVGGAVVRNRAKRRLREIVRHHLGQIKPGFDFVVIARSDAATVDYGELERAVVTLVSRAGVLTPAAAGTSGRGVTTHS